MYLYILFLFLPDCRFFHLSSEHTDRYNKICCLLPATHAHFDKYIFFSIQHHIYATVREARKLVPTTEHNSEVPEKTVIYMIDEFGSALYFISDLNQTNKQNVFVLELRIFYLTISQRYKSK